MGLGPTSPSSWRVCQFRHPGKARQFRLIRQGGTVKQTAQGMQGQDAPATHGLYFSSLRSARRAWAYWLPLRHGSWVRTSLPISRSIASASTGSSLRPWP